MRFEIFLQPPFAPFAQRFSTQALFFAAKVELEVVLVRELEIVKALAHVFEIEEGVAL